MLHSSCGCSQNTAELTGGMFVEGYRGYIFTFMHLYVCNYLPVYGCEHSQKLIYLFLWFQLPAPHLHSSLPPRASFPVLLTLPTTDSLDSVSDFPRKGLCGGHGVKNTAFLMHSLGKWTKRPFRLSELVTWSLFLSVLFS